MAALQTSLSVLPDILRSTMQGILTPDNINQVVRVVNIYNELQITNQNQPVTLQQVQERLQNIQNGQSRRRTKKGKGRSRSRKH